MLGYALVCSARHHNTGSEALDARLRDDAVRPNLLKDGRRSDDKVICTAPCPAVLDTAQLAHMQYNDALDVEHGQRTIACTLHNAGIRGVMVMRAALHPRCRVLLTAAV